MLLIDILIIFGAAILGGTLNGVAGGGSFLTFPALLYIGVAPIEANATSTAALWPGSAAASWALRKELVHQNKTLLLILGITGFIGGAGGALLLLKTPQTTFTLLIPYLLLLATILFTLSPLVNARVKRRVATKQKELAELATEEAGSRVSAPARTHSRFSGRSLIGIAVLQLIISIYGGYFGGGIGILTLAVLGLLGIEDINEMNAVKNILVVCINGVAVITFVAAGAVVWFNALVMVGGTIIGGYGGVYFARKLDQRIVRVFVILVGCAMSLYFFYKYGFF